MQTEFEAGVFKGVSRSFYLSLRLLPAGMRRPASIAYLLARASDTIADSAGVAAGYRAAALEQFAEQVARGETFIPIQTSLIEGTPCPRERLLLERVGEVFAGLRSLAPAEILLIREVLEVIIGGQLLDLERFGDATPSSPVSLSSDEELEDYTWRVAGCVGVFWTKLAYLTLGEKFSLAPEAELLAHAKDYGKSLQLVNILRDLPEDLADGRCYLPIADPTDKTELMMSFSKWRIVAVEKLGSGFSYAQNLESRRIRAASILPGMIAKETLALLDGVDFETLQKRIKVPRRQVYAMIFRSFFVQSGKEMKRS